MSNLARILGKPNGKPSFSPDKRWVLPTDLVGLEFEYEGVEDPTLPRHTYADFFTYHEEHSLKDQGAEFVFTAPLFGTDIFNAVNWIVAHAVNNKWKCTKRTGIHVHLDVRDLEVPQLAGMTILYAALEPILYRWVGDGREASHFCLPLYSADDALYRACTIIRSALMDDEKGSLNALSQAENYQRYAGFNLNALAKFGSVEFRHLQTTHDLNRIFDWINILMSIKAAAFKLPTSDGAVIKMMERMGAVDTLNYVFPLALANKLYSRGDSETRFERWGLPSARDIAIHGCTRDVWVAPKFPKGDNQGFATWIKQQGKKKTKKEALKVNPEAMVADMDFLDDIEDDEPAPRPIAPPAINWEQDPFGPRPDRNAAEALERIRRIQVQFNNQGPQRRR